MGAPLRIADVATQAAPATAAPTQAAPPRPKRCKHLPPRDENGLVRGVVEVAAATTDEQRQRFRILAHVLHRRWFLERPSPLSSGEFAVAVSSQSPSPIPAATATATAS